jgi:aryl-alcohol dehydrogenase-like predicted oxidoreductase
MQTRPLGATGHVVSRLGFGLAAVGRPGYLNVGHGEDLAGRSDPNGLGQHTNQMLDAAFAAGVNYFDTARSYGRGEQYLADWLDEGRPDGVTIGSKWGYEYVAGWKTDAAVHETKDLSADTFDRQHAETVALLGDHLALYQVHSATRASGVLDNPEVLHRLAELRNSGVAVGLTTSGTDQSRTIRDAIGIEIDGRPLFATVQSTWNLLEPSAGSALAEAADAGLGVIVKEAVANGRLTERNTHTAERAAASGSNQSVDAIALAAALHQPWVSVVLSGAATLEQLRSNLEALNVTADETDALKDLAEPADQYWTTRSELMWT